MIYTTPLSFLTLKNKAPNVAEEVRKSFLKDKEELINEDEKSWFNNVFDRAKNNVNNELGILSLSKNWNNTLMWSHYTNSHKGFCVGFNPNHKFFDNYVSNDGKYSRTVHEVSYSENRIKIPICFSEERLYFKPFITKSIDWKYEDEVRVLSSLNLANKIIEFQPLDLYLFAVPHSAILEIIVGANISSENKNVVQYFCKKNNINLFEAKISDTKFDMERK